MSTVGCVVLTQGRRPAELRRAVESLLGQRGIACDVLVVGNGWEPVGLPDGARAIATGENLGATAGRNAGAAHVDGELLFFLDDDARLASDDALARIGARFAAEPDLAVLQPRVADPDGRPEPRSWVPRLRVGDRGRSSDVTSVWEGAVAVRRRVFEEVGGWPEQFFYSHEGIDLAWRVLDRGLRVHYAGDIVAFHPAAAPDRPDVGRYVRARNRVWLARRYLPRPLAAVYVAVWAARTVAGVRSRQAAREAARGLRDGIRLPAGARRPLSARTLWRMTRAGRPPIL